ncbi:MAG: histidine phosphatase family protein [Rubrimonas sp.]
MKRLILVRHGETEWNAAHRLQGQSDIALSDTGRAQARALAPLVAGLAPDLALASDLHRARETSALIGYAGADLVPTLREQRLGDWEGRTVCELDADDYRAWRIGDYTPPGGETFEALSARVGSAMTDAAARCGSAALLTCHGGVIRAALAALIGLPPSRIAPVGPASATIILCEDDVFRLEAFNLSPTTGQGRT